MTQDFSEIRTQNTENLQDRTDRVRRGTCGGGREGRKGWGRLRAHSGSALGQGLRVPCGPRQGNRHVFLEEQGAQKTETL